MSSDLKKTLYNLTIIIVTSDKSNDESMNDERLIPKLKEYQINIQKIHLNINNIKMNLSNRINKTVSRHLPHTKAIAITNVFPDLHQETLQELSSYHQNNKTDFLYHTEFNHKFFLKESYFWLSFNSEQWKNIGGFNTMLRFPFNITNEFSERCLSKDLTQGDLDLRIKKPSFFHLYHDKPENLIKYDHHFLPHTYTSQNHLESKGPDFLIIGAQKSCSTTLRHSLGLHPEIHIPRLISNSNGPSSEISFFNTNLWNKLGLEWYKTFFHHSDKKVSGEKTPEYISSPLAHQRIKEAFPNIKLIASLRNPVDRAWSGLNHIRSKNTKWGLQLGKDGTAPDAFDLISREHLDDNIIQKGCYSKQLKSLYSFFPKEQVKIFIHERLTPNHDAIYKEIFEFLGVDNKVEIPKLHSHKGSYSETRYQETLIRLYEYYKPYNEELFDILGYDIPEWDMPSF